MSETSTAAFARPRTANPKLESLNLIDAQIHSHPSFNVPSPPATQRGIGEGSVIWSQDMVPVEELSRPHTSNPRYVEMTTQKLETPRRSSPPQNHDTPSRASQADTTSAVLWASDAQDISPAMLARPLTSNPWLTRFLDGAPGDVKAASDGRRSGVEILWSDKEIEDWRLLARPHASNPVYEASVEASRNEMKPVTNVSAVLWSSDEMSSDEVIQLRALVQSQQYRIGELEAHVAMLQDQISALAVAAGKTPVVQSVDILRFPSANDLTATQELVEVITAISPSNVAAPPGPTPNTVRTTRPTPSPRPRSTGSGGVDDHSPRNVPLTRASTALGHREDEDEVVVAHDPAATQEHEPDVAEDDGDADDSAFIKVASEKPTNSRFAQRLRETTSGLQQPVRPDTAGAARPAPLYEGTVAPPRPSSAPVARKRFDAVPASFPTLVSQAIVAEDSIMKAYDALRVPGNPFVSKESFRKYYTARAAEFGTPCTKSMLDRLLRPYKSKGEDVLSLEEFAVLYLQFQRW